MAGNRTGGDVVIRGLGQPGDLGWVVMAHGEVYAEQFGWDTSFEVLVAQIVADYSADHDAAREAAWIAEVDGRRAGCIFCVAADETTAKLRILLVHPAERGHGLGGRLVDTCLGFARGAGYQRMRLWTNDPLISARRIYLDRGFVLIEEQLHHGFGVDMIGQTYELALSPLTMTRGTGPAAKSRGSVPVDVANLAGALQDGRTVC